VGCRAENLRRMRCHINKFLGLPDFSSFRGCSCNISKRMVSRQSCRWLPRTGGSEDFVTFRVPFAQLDLCISPVFVNDDPAKSCQYQSENFGVLLRKHVKLKIETHLVKINQIKAIGTIPEVESFPLHWPLSCKHVLDSRHGQQSSDMSHPSSPSNRYEYTQTPV